MWKILGDNFFCKPFKVRVTKLAHQEPFPLCVGFGLPVFVQIIIPVPHINLFYHILRKIFTIRLKRGIVFMMNTKQIIIPKSIGKKYAGLTAAVVKNKVVAAGATTTEVLSKAKKKYPLLKEEEIGIMTLPPKSGVWV